MKQKIGLLVIISFLFWACVGTGNVSTGSSGKVNFEVEHLAENLGTPWGLAFVSSNEILITEREGSVKKLNITTGEIDVIAGAPEVLARSQGGLLDVAVPPGYVNGDWIYFTYSKKVKGLGTTTLARAQLMGKKLIHWQELLIADSRSGRNLHFGSRIAFDAEDHIFFSIGDRGVRPNGQDITNHAGTILRLNLDGSVPGDNPFAGKNGRDEIWSYGHRNPQGLFWDKITGTLWSSEHGPRGGDEINQIEPGQNYGWPVVSHGKEYTSFKSVGEATSKPGMTDPVKVYIPSIAPGSLIVYSGKAFPEWKGDLFLGALALTHLNRVILGADGIARQEERLLEDLDERIRAVQEGPDGYIYFSTDSGKIMRIRPSAR